MQLSLKDWFSHNDPTVRNAAQMIATYQDELKAGKISRAEYDDLCQDATDLSSIDRDSLKVGELEMIQTAFQGLMLLASNIK